MRIIILCEGTTDVILVQLLLQYRYGWVYDGFVENTVSNRLIKRKVKKGESSIEICSCDGINNIPKEVRKIKDLIQNATRRTELYDKMIIMIDHDTVESNKGFIQQMNAIVGEEFSEEQLNCWSEWSIKNIVFGIWNVDMFWKCVPETEIGAIETVMLQALNTDKTEEFIIEQSEKFIHDLSESQERYLQKKSRICKAVFNTYFAIRTPEEKYDERAKILKAYDWNGNEVLEENFCFLDRV